MPAVNGLVGDGNYGTDIPQSQTPDEKDLSEEKKIAKYSKSKEFQRIKEYMQGRIDFYQKFLPTGEDVSSSVKPEDWVIANTLIKEFTVFTKSYDTIAQAVEDQEKQS